MWPSSTPLPKKDCSAQHTVDIEFEDLLELVSLTLELYTVPEFGSASSALSVAVNQLAPAGEFQSTAGALFEQVLSEVASDYAVVNLGRGQQWLTSRLFIYAVVWSDARSPATRIGGPPLVGFVRLWGSVTKVLRLTSGVATLAVLPCPC